MSAFNRTEKDDRWPLGQDEGIRALLNPATVKVSATLAGAAPGLYVLFTTPNATPVLYAGPVIGPCVVMAFWWLLTRAGRHHGATHAELVRKTAETGADEWAANERRPVPPENDGWLWGE